MHKVKEISSSNIFRSHISSCQKWFGIYFPQPGKLGYFNVIKYSLDEIFYF